MKKRFVILSIMVLAVLLTAGVAAAVSKSQTGCGLGYMIFKDAGDATVIQVLAVTTNGIGSQTLAITTGTLECKQPAVFVKNERLNEFVAGNMDNLASDIAAGQGELLDTLAELMEVPTVKRAEFDSTLQANFGIIFSSDDIQSAQVIDNIVKVAS